MRAPIGWWWPLLAVLATAVAFAVGPQYSIAVPAATVAVIAAALTIVEAIVRQRAFSMPMVGPRPIGPVGTRGAFVGGEAGRADIVQSLDLLDRKMTHPGLPMRSRAEVEQIVSGSPAEFRAYVAKRLDELEGPT